MVAPEGLEPSSRCSEHRVLPLDDKAMAVSTGVAPAFSALTRQRLHGFGIETAEQYSGRSTPYAGSRARLNRHPRGGPEGDPSFWVLGTAVLGTVPKRAAGGSHPAAACWRPPWSLDRGPSALRGSHPHRRCGRPELCC